MVLLFWIFDVIDPAPLSHLSVLSDGIHFVVFLGSFSLFQRVDGLAKELPSLLRSTHALPCKNLGVGKFPSRVPFVSFYDNDIIVDSVAIQLGFFFLNFKVYAGIRPPSCVCSEIFRHFRSPSCVNSHLFLAFDGATVCAVQHAALAVKR